MKQQIFPYDSDSHEIKFLHDHCIKSQVIYIAILVLITAMFISLPFIQVSISIQSRGIIRPLSEFAEIRILPSAPVSTVYIHEGQRVEEGDTIMVLESEGIDGKLQFIRQELRILEDYILDLQNLIDETNRTFFHSDLYRIQNINFRKKVSEIDFRIERANLEVVRQQPLIDSLLISKKEFEVLKNCRDQLDNEKKIIEASQKVMWRSELEGFRSKRDSYISQFGQMVKEQELYTIKSPVKGSIESFSGIYPGCNLQSGQVVAVISPDNTLTGEVFVIAKNIGLLYRGMPVKIQIDAFNYNEWGMISGKITRISDDYSMVNNVPVFKVQCSLDSACLRLRNGTPGIIKKGMTMNTRFLVSKRSLFQLIYQKSDDLLNPVRNSAVISHR